MVALTIGMPTYNDFDGVYFTVQALRHYQDLEDTELVVVDNYGCEHTRAFVEGWSQGAVCPGDRCRRDRCRQEPRLCRSAGGGRPLLRFPRDASRPESLPG